MKGISKNFNFSKCPESRFKVDDYEIINKYLKESKKQFEIALKDNRVTIINFLKGNHMLKFRKILKSGNEPLKSLDLEKKKSQLL